jgi:hypothetical protein
MSGMGGKRGLGGIGRQGDKEMGGWGDGEMGDGEMGRRRDKAKGRIGEGEE